MGFLQFLSIFFTSGASTVILNRLFLKKDKNFNIQEQQYLNVISPIHHALKNKDKNERDKVIEEIIEKYYYLLPDTVYECYIDCKENENNFEEFNKLINYINNRHRYELGYSKQKPENIDTKIEKLLPRPTNSLILDLISWVAFSLTFLLIFLVIVGNNNMLNADNLMFSTLMSLGVLIITLIIAVVIYVKRR